MNEKPQSQVLLYQTEDGKSRLEVRMENETVWLTQNQMAELFQTTKQNISLHIRNLFAERELDRAATVKEYLTVQEEGRRQVTRTVVSRRRSIKVISVSKAVGFCYKGHRSL